MSKKIVTMRKKMIIPRMLDIKKMIRLGKSKFEISKKIVTMRRKMIIPRMLDIKKMVIIKVIMITMQWR